MGDNRKIQNDKFAALHEIARLAEVPAVIDAKLTRLSLPALQAMATLVRYARAAGIAEGKRPITPDLAPLDDTETAFLVNNQLVYAVKHYRERTNSTLKDAVDLCRSAMQTLKYGVNNA